VLGPATRWSLNISQTFFDPDWAPDVMIGPATLTFLLDHCRRNFASVDIISTILQVSTFSRAFFDIMADKRAVSSRT
jgi:hypothetical protein